VIIKGIVDKPLNCSEGSRDAVMCAYHNLSVNFLVLHVGDSLDWW